MSAADGFGPGSESGFVADRDLGLLVGSQAVAVGVVPGDLTQFNQRGVPSRLVFHEPVAELLVARCGALHDVGR